MLRVGVTIKQIENKHLQNLINFSNLNHLGGHKKIRGELPPNALPWLWVWDTVVVQTSSPLRRLAYTVKCQEKGSYRSRTTEDARYG